MVTYSDSFWKNFVAAWIGLVLFMVLFISCNILEFDDLLARISLITVV
jgi:hypothetical protein